MVPVLSFQGCNERPLLMLLQTQPQVSVALRPMSYRGAFPVVFAFWGGTRAPSQALKQLQLVKHTQLQSLGHCTTHKMKDALRCKP